MFLNDTALTEVILGTKFQFVGDDGYLPKASADNEWFVKGDDSTTLTPTEIADYQSTATGAFTYIRK
ncbi:MAG: hypothetical protein NC213_00235 [Acetobacter sp.]|nr:hypothetical protein [Bacteroides sp.]MCM1340153.1 hypothetical protein [Acetobacter sp.]MCM1432895.1 hypothetical protein [Clostridiales bacterium]